MAAHELRFGFGDSARADVALAALERAGFGAWAFSGDGEFAVVLYVDAPLVDSLAAESIVRAVDPTAVVVRHHGWDPLA